MKTILKEIWAILENIGKARAAAAMARSGDFKGAQAIMLAD